MKTTSFQTLLALVASATLFSPLPVLADKAAALPENLLVSSAPAGALSVAAARKDAKPGTGIVVRGRIGGRLNPLVEKAAIAVLADEKAITACSDIPGDNCKTPWDYCCETSEKLKGSTVTIQVKGEGGKVLRTPLRGLGGLKELSTVVVKGTVDKASSKDVLIINIEAMHVEKP